MILDYIDLLLERKKLNYYGGDAVVGGIAGLAAGAFDSYKPIYWMAALPQIYDEGRFDRKDQNRWKALGINLGVSIPTALATNYIKTKAQGSS